jgi:transcription initiation factor TFIID subunit 6
VSSPVYNFLSNQADTLIEQKGRKQSPPRSILAPVAPALQPGAANRKYKPVKHVLSRELQIYYSRLTAALLPSNVSTSDDGQQSARRAAALASLQHDAGLQNLLPYLVRWVGQSVVNAIRNQDERDRNKKGNDTTGETLEILLKVIHALIQNDRLFIEPYVSGFYFSQ